MKSAICCANCDCFGIDIRNGKAICCCGDVEFGDRYIVDVEHDFCSQFRNTDYIVVNEED